MLGMPLSIIAQSSKVVVLSHEDAWPMQECARILFRPCSQESPPRPSEACDTLQARLARSKAYLGPVHAPSPYCRSLHAIKPNWGFLGHFECFCYFLEDFGFSKDKELNQA